MSLRNACLAVPLLALALMISACSSDEPAPESGETAKAKVKAEDADDRPVNVPILEGFKYYVAGPMMKKDPYGRYRITDFQGEVAQPPSRGLIFGVKRDGDRFEYRVWANGRLVGTHKGAIRDGLYWPEYREGYRDQKLVAREYVTNDDEAKLMRLKLEDIDPATGEVIRTSEYAQSYKPPVIPNDEDDDELFAEFEEDDDAATAPAPPAEKAPVAAPADKAGAQPTPGSPAAPAPPEAQPTPGSPAAPPPAGTGAPSAPAAPAAPAQGH
ncbi:MAG TPA: hypothetical protein VEL28_16025 [Candidatus Binatia bacterium]|nr:hypothetical protein [Candidatus Binatia bacterium]